MIRIIQIFFLSIFLIACFKAKKTDNSEKQISLATSNKQSNEASENQQYLSNIEDFKKFISRKWIALIGDEPCGSFERTISFDNTYLYEYNGMEPSEYKIDDIKLINSKTLDIKIQNSLDRDIVFRVEILNFKEKLVRWTLNGEEYYEKTKPYDDVCTKIKRLYQNPKELIIPNLNWLGEYYFEEDGVEKTILISKNEMIYEAIGMRHHNKFVLNSSQVGDTLALYFTKSLSGNVDLSIYEPLIKLYKKNNEYFIKSIMTNEDWKETKIDKN